MPNITDNLPNIPQDVLVQSNFWMNPTWLTWLNTLVGLVRRSPTISTGIAAPTSIPNKIGNMYIDTVLSKVYVSTGIVSSSDWKILN